MEKRTISTQYQQTDGKLWGYAAVWDSPTQIREGGKSFTEVIKRSAFGNISRDVIATYNHDPSKLLGRTSSGTLRLSTDDHGLRFELDLPDTETGREVRALTSRGDLAGASFTFSVRKDAWPSKTTRELIDVDLIELGPVTMPAYASTTVGLRSSAKDWYAYRLRLMAKS